MATRSLAGERHYAHSLLRIANKLAARQDLYPAVAMYDGNTLERRITHMLNRPRKLNPWLHKAVVATLTLVASGGCAAMASMHMDMQSSTSSSNAIRVKSEVMATRTVIKVQPLYPAKAKAEHNTKDGTCILSVLIGKDGKPENVHVQQSLRSDYDESALTAVRRWKWEPLLVNGKPVRVETTVSVTYTIQK